MAAHQTYYSSFHPVTHDLVVNAAFQPVKVSRTIIPPTPVKKHSWGSKTNIILLTQGRVKGPISDKTGLSTYWATSIYQSAPESRFQLLFRRRLGLCHPTREGDGDQFLADVNHTS
ncbi:hypothetical protein AVEN_206917-1 [Araneus ventricosus]|uniref:Uncharacterized protein n=1 Tax=Araneus ventricosus TaxID=182803 RepID=A0A4Y2RG18_ARAVE|nr:hypothetical protein AVEN_206917-1 [Araneus ventricosus]